VTNQLSSTSHASQSVVSSPFFRPLITTRSVASTFTPNSQYRQFVNPYSTEIHIQRANFLTGVADCGSCPDWNVVDKREFTTGIVDLVHPFVHTMFNVVNVTVTLQMLPIMALKELLDEAGYIAMCADRTIPSALQFRTSKLTNTRKMAVKLWRRVISLGIINPVVHMLHNGLLPADVHAALTFLEGTCVVDRIGIQKMRCDTLLFRSKLGGSERNSGDVDSKGAASSACGIDTRTTHHTRCAAISVRGHTEMPYLRYIASGSHSFFGLAPTH
jgi:hypothetical protein